MAVVPPGQLPTPNSKYAPPCDSRFAEGFIRGAYVGALWGAFFHRYDVQSPQAATAAEATGNELVSKRQSLIQAAKMRTYGACKHAGLMAVFLGLYSGSSCVAEKALGRRNWASSFIGGFTAGTFAGMVTGSHPQHALTWGVGTGVASTLVYILQGP